MGKYLSKMKIIRVVVLAVLSTMLLYIFFNEANHTFSSDIPAHIRFAISETEPGYSLIYPFLAFSYTYGSHFGVAVFLTALQIATIVICERFMRRLLPDVREEVVFALAIVANFVVAIYILVIHPHFSKGLSKGNAWHNSTFMGMKFFALIAVWMYLRFVGYLESRNKVLDWAALTVCIVASAAVKPSFVVVFGPTVVIFCVVDLVKGGVKTIKRSLALAVPFVLVLGILYYQYTLLYVEDTSSGIELGFAVVWRHSHPFFPLGILQSYAFLILVFLFCFKKFKGDFNYQMALVMFAIGLAIFLFVNETGARMYHGNFAWSLKFGVYYLFIESMVIYVRAYGSKFSFVMKESAAEPAAVPASADVLAATDAPVLADAPMSADAPTPVLAAEASSGGGEGLQQAAGESPAEELAVATGNSDASIAPEERKRPNFWPELFILAVLGLHFLSGCGSILKIMIGHGYG